MAKLFEDPDALADEVIARVGRKIVLALPLGLGKANRIANALFARAAADPTLHLRIFTALTLEKPRYGNELQRRFLEPVIERLFGDWPEIAYARAQRKGALPANIEVNEFFFPAGQLLNVPLAQQSYISTNYTNAVRAVAARGINVVGQLVAKQDSSEGSRYSLSCNTDLTLELLSERRKGSVDFLLLGEVSGELPFMPGEGVRPSSDFHAVLDDRKGEYPLFAPPNEPVDLAEYAIGFHVARTIVDGGTLQIGIGQEGDATAHALTLRQSRNELFRQAIANLGIDATSRDFMECAPFDVGLYAATEMFTEAFLALHTAGILRREVNGAVLHGAFFLGSKNFYRGLNALEKSVREKFQMTSVMFTNSLYRDEDAKRAARTHARFVNNAMMATLLGAAVSDGLEDGRVVSGVGGQYDFVAQAFALEGARSLLCLKSTRERRGALSSNIRFSYGHETIPRHLRDIVVTEYGIADLRDKSDADVVAAMLSVADSRFQPELLRRAKDAGKIPRSYEIPRAFRDNSPEKIERALGPMRARGFLPAFPLGTDFDDTEQALIPVLELLDRISFDRVKLAQFAISGMMSGPVQGEKDLLARMRLESPSTLMEHLYRALLRAGIRQTRIRKS